RQPFLVLVLPEGMELALVLLAGGQLGHAGLRLGLGAGALDVRLLPGLDLGLSSLLLVGAALPVVVFGAEAGLLLVLALPSVVEPALLFLARAGLGLDLLLFLAILRVAQDLLDGDHHRGFLPFRHGALFRCGSAT